MCVQDALGIPQFSAGAIAGVRHARSLLVQVHAPCIVYWTVNGRFVDTPLLPPSRLEHEDVGAVPLQRESLARSQGVRAQDASLCACHALRK